MSNKLRDQLHRILGAKYASISLTFKLHLKLQSSVITCYHYDWAGSDKLPQLQGLRGQPQKGW